MRLHLLAALAFLGALTPSARAATTIPGGNVINETWTPAGSPYVVQGDVTVPSGSTLTIQAGTVVQFAAGDAQVAGMSTTRSELTVKGTLNVTGTAGSPVTFQAASGTSAGTWYGIVADSGGSVSISGAIIEHAYYPLYQLAGGVFTIQRCTVRTYTNYGAYLTGTAAVDGLTAIGGSGGVYVWNPTGGTLSNLLVQGASDYGVYVMGSGTTSTLTIANATIHGNGSYGIYAYASVGTLSLSVRNAVVTNQFYGIYRSGSGSAMLAVTYSNVWGNSTANYGGGASAGASCISQNPQYVSPPTDLHLQSSSVCIDAGTSAGAPPTDLDGNPRPTDGDGINGATYDMGAYELQPVPVCGDGVVGSGETCDEGGVNGTYGHCKADCSGLGPHCGDGLVNGSEACDDAGLNGTYGHCKADCSGLGPHCGDGLVNGSEACDDAGLNGTYGHCASDCTGPGPRCGDGVVNGSEACDDAGLNGMYGHCKSDCTALGPRCGDGVVNGSEACDDAGLNGTYGHCASDCTALGPRCGDGVVNGAETCDDGNLAAGDGCSPTCTHEASPSPSGGGGGGGCSSGANGALPSVALLAAFLRARRRKRHAA